jgi:hypothetical protein
VGVKVLIVAALVALLGAAGSARADNPVLTGDVGRGDAFTISLTGPSGSVTHLDPGTYTLVVHDRSALHNFHLFGPGVDVSTGIDQIGDQTFTLTVADGKYTFQCDEHATSMKGTFTVGAVTTPPPVTKLTGSIGPGAKISLSRTAGLSAGTFKLTVADRSAIDGFRLAGPGVAKATGVSFRGTVAWTVKLQAGKYSFGSVRNAKLRRTFTVSN